MDKLNNFYDSIVKCTDPRVQDWILFNSPYVMPSVIILYLYFIFIYGPHFMKNREPYSLKTFMKCYNILQVVLNSYIVYKILKGDWYTRIWIYCVPITYEATPENFEFLQGCWVGMVTKIMDLLETGIFVLRKKNKQISFLHIYHHLSTLLIAWIYGKNVCGGMAIFIPLLNCSVHVIMYIYYFLTLCNQNVRSVINKYKYCVTIIQMVQFVILIIHVTQAILPSCDCPKKEPIILMINCMINFYLFYNFFKNTYTNKKIKQY